MRRPCLSSRVQALALIGALLPIGACLQPRPAADRPLSYRAPIPGWVRHDIDSTLSLLLPPDLQREPRADTAFAPVFFASDSARVTVYVGTDLSAPWDALMGRASDKPRHELRNANSGSFVRFQPGPPYTRGDAALYVSAPDHPFMRLGDRFRSDFCPRVVVLVAAEQQADVFDSERVWDFVRLRCPTR